MARAARLFELESMTGFRIPPDEPDPRGWSIVASDGLVVGAVRTLLVDADRRKACYFVAELRLGARLVLLPVSLARLDARERRIIFDVSPAHVFAALADYTGSAPDTRDDDRMLELLAGIHRARPQPGASVDGRGDVRRDSSSG